MYRLAHILQKNCPWLWHLIEWLNGWLFFLRYHKRLQGISDILKKYQSDYVVKELEHEDVPCLATFFTEQPEEAFEFFRPHAFDEKTLRRLAKNPSYLAFVVYPNDTEKEQIISYFFIRCYFIGKGFRGYMVDYRYRNRGISKLSAMVMTDVAKALGIPTFGTIAPENISSLRSQGAVNEIRIIEQLNNGDYYVEYVAKNEE